MSETANKSVSFIGDQTFKSFLKCKMNNFGTVFFVLYEEGGKLEKEP